MNKQNYTLTIFLGDVFESTAKVALAYDPGATLIDYENLNSVINKTLINDTVYYTSLGDVGAGNYLILMDLLYSATNVVYCPPEKWSDGATVDILDPTSSIQGQTEDVLLRLPANVKVSNFSKEHLVHDPRPLVDHRQSDRPQIWIAGCSISHGVGVDSSERYGQLLAEDLKMPVSFLTRPGSAIDWAADQILRSEIREGDIVIWGLTSIERITFVHNHCLETGITNTTYQNGKNQRLEKIVPQKTLFSQNTFYTHIYSIDQVTNFCKKCKAILIIVGLLTSGAELRFLASNPYFHNYTYKTSVNNSASLFNFNDTGDDNQHPGPKQHTLYKDFILSLI